MTKQEKIYTEYEQPQPAIYTDYGKQSRQEEIRAGIEEVICDCCDDVVVFLEAGQTLIEAQEYCRKEGVCAYATDLREAIQKYETSKGVVLKVEGELPLEGLERLSGSAVITWFNANGYSAWEPLIGDKDG
ncbi:hypothetical protein LCGC14_0629480 [marine sediment metagenome]|uniref:Uncharacterized protein n=1 Tax=marine sediment metagenome TaxID=412755 RepID=A0A0F9UAY8_9ZZZZ